MFELPTKGINAVAFLTVAVFGIALIAPQAASAQVLKKAARVEPVTKITIEGMHCAGCAKKVGKKLETIKNVAKVTMNFETSTATITPKEKSEFSNKSVWETIEALGYKPTKLINAKGTLTEKPKE